MRIQNSQQLLSTGNVEGRKHALQILEAGLRASDPYYNTKILFRMEDTKLYIGNPDFEADNDPDSGIDCYDIRQFDHIYVVGAGKGVQRVALAIEEILGDYLTGGHVICKHGDADILQRIGFTHGNHPTPDIHCIEGCKRIVALAEEVTERDLVITIIANGASSLLTYPAEGIALEDVVEVTRLIQIEHGAPTTQLNKIRNHIDRMKGGKLAKLFAKAKQVHIVAVDIGHQDGNQRYDYYGVMQRNTWLHSLPENTSFADARRVLHHYDAWEACPASIRRLLEAEPAQLDTVKWPEYQKLDFRAFGVMPEKKGFLKAAAQQAQALGYESIVLTDKMEAAASQVGRLLSSIAVSTENGGNVFQAPVAFFMVGEMLVQKDKYFGIGGRNQECMLSAAKDIAGSRRIVCASADTDGTDGPGGFASPGAPKCFSGAIVDGFTCATAQERGVDIDHALKHHDTSAALWVLDSAIHATQGISLNDLILALVMKAP